MVKQCAVDKKITKEGKEMFVCDTTRSKLLPALQEIQDKRGYISDKDMQAVADQFDIHPVEVYSVVTFYSFLTVEKKGKHIIRISNCMPNIMAGSKKIEKEFEKALKIKRVIYQIMICKPLLIGWIYIRLKFILLLHFILF